ncbi:Uncharacterised protein [Mycobacteroides abscessus subsp. abscessus]|nr:Uncharacterised protein [Mycobacteroides abscessus subsp. abscessus]
MFDPKLSVHFALPEASVVCVSAVGDFVTVPDAAVALAPTVQPDAFCSLPPFWS